MTSVDMSSVRKSNGGKKVSLRPARICKAMRHNLDAWEIWFSEDISTLVMGQPN